MRCVLLLRQCGVCTVSLLFRNIIKVDLASRAMSLQAPGLFADALDVKYFNSSNTGILLFHSVGSSYVLTWFRLLLLFSCVVSNAADKPYLINTAA